MSSSIPQNELQELLLDRLDTVTAQLCMKSWGKIILSRTFWNYSLN